MDKTNTECQELPHPLCPSQGAMCLRALGIKAVSVLNMRNQRIHLVPCVLVIPKHRFVGCFLNSLLS